MNNNSTETTRPKSVTTRAVTVLSLILIISFIAWLSVQIVAVAPSAFSSLASLTDAISTARDEAVVEMNEPTTLTIENATQTINSSDATTLSWTKIEAPGSYVFRYACVPGVTIEATDAGGFRTLNCDTNYDLGDVNSVTLALTSTEVRNTTVSYTVSFLKTNGTTPAATGSGSIVVNNETLPDPNAPTPEVIVEVEEPAAEVPATPTPAPEPDIEFVYEIPVSIATGTPDLRASFVAVGEIRNNRFIPGTVQKNDTGAIQFEVRNIGNKTSERWTFTVELPDGTTYTSDSQPPLRPNERATLSLSFISDNSTRHAFEVSVETDVDRLETNNTFRQVINFQ